MKRLSIGVALLVSTFLVLPAQAKLPTPRGVKEVSKKVWSPDKKHVLLLGKLGKEKHIPGMRIIETSDIWIVQANGSGLKRLTRHGEGTTAVWSPDGKQYAIIDRDSLYVFNRATSKRKRIAKADLVLPRFGGHPQNRRRTSRRVRRCSWPRRNDVPSRLSSRRRLWGSASRVIAASVK